MAASNTTSTLIATVKEEDLSCDEDHPNCHHQQKPLQSKLLFLNRKINPGKKVVFEEMDQHFRGESSFFSGDNQATAPLRRFLTLDEPWYPELVVEFYRNLRPTGTASHRAVSSVVRGVSINLDERTLGAITELRPRGLDVTSTDRYGHVSNRELEARSRTSVCRPGVKSKARLIPLGDLKPLACVLALVVANNLAPRAGHDNRIRTATALMVWAMMEGKEVNWPRVFLRTMVEAGKGGGRKKLPYGMLLTRVFWWFGVDMRDKASYRNTRHIDALWLMEKKLWVFKGEEEEEDGGDLGEEEEDGQDIGEEDEAGGAEDAYPTPEPSEAAAASHYMSDLHKFMTEISEHHAEIKSNVDDIMDRMAAVESNIECRLEELEKQYNQALDYIQGRSNAAATDDPSSPPAD